MIEKEYFIYFHSSIPAKTINATSLTDALKKAKETFYLSEIIEVVEGEWKKGYREHLYRCGRPL